MKKEDNAFVIGSALLELLKKELGLDIRKLKYCGIRKDLYFVEFVVRRNKLLGILNRMTDAFLIRTLVYFWFFDSQKQIAAFFQRYFPAELQRIVAFRLETVDEEHELLQVAFMFKDNIMPEHQLERVTEEILAKEKELKTLFTKLTKRKFRRGVEAANVYCLRENYVLYGFRGFLSAEEQAAALEDGEVKRTYTKMHQIQEKVFLDIVKEIHQDKMDSNASLEAVCHFESNSGIVKVSWS